MTPFAELAVTTNFSFLRGASHPEELVARALELGLAGIAVADRNTVAGVVRGHVAAKETGYRYAVGARLAFRDGTPDVLAWPTDRAAWGRLCRLLTLGNRRAEKGDCHLDLPDLLEWGQGTMLGVMPGSTKMLRSEPGYDGRAGHPALPLREDRNRVAVSGRGNLAVVEKAPLPEAASPLRPSLKGRVGGASTPTPVTHTLAALREAFPGNVRLMANRLY
ncbi:MAG TPA: PHP domain-containing protein, partial [Bauldia sp.]|nr:PHP domain-containing protein [Bauldia sp.]